MAATTPKLLGPAYADVAARVEALAAALTRTKDAEGTSVEGWAPPPPGEMDAGRALIRVFERMARYAIDRINDVPDRSFLAFLDRTGVEPAGARAARVPLTFTLVARGDAEPIVPAGTLVGAEPLPGDAREVAFETERDLVTTRARLVAAFGHQPDGDRVADRTAKITGAEAGFFEAFDGGEPAPHFFYVAADDVFAVPAGTSSGVAFIVTADAVATWAALLGSSPVALAADPYYATHVPAPPLIQWTYWNGSAWVHLATSASPVPQQSRVVLLFQIPADMAATSVNGRTARWIRGQLRAWPAAGLPPISAMNAGSQLKLSGLAPLAALIGGQPVDLSMDFFPFGEQPRLNNHVLLACDARHCRPGFKLDVNIVLNSQSTQPLKAAEQPTVAWEISTATGWTRCVTPDVKPTGTVVGDKIANDVLRSASFTVPADAAPQTIGGVRAVWLRIRFSGGSFGRGPSIGSNNTVTDDGYRPPIVTSVTLSLAGDLNNASPLLATQGYLTFADRTAPLVPFTRSADATPSIALGFDRPFAPRDTHLHFQVAPLDPASAAKDTATAGGRVAWEYWSASGKWVPLAGEDETRGLLASGALRFVAPADLARRALFGKELFWLRLRQTAPKGAPPPPSPRLGRVLTNTVWARDAVAVANEVLGSSDGNKGRTFSFASRPVLAGQRVDVREDEAWVTWQEVTDFYTSGPRDRHYMLDREAGVVHFGDGQRGMIPPKGAQNVRATSYLAGGGAVGNRPARAVKRLKTTVPYVDSVTNHEPATGGADRETLDAVKEWGPRALRHGNRAVTAEDFEDLAYEASSSVARARVITPSFDAIALASAPAVPAPLPGVPAPGGVVLLIAAEGSDMPPAPTAGLLRDVEAYIRARSAGAVALRVVGPTWIEVRINSLTVVASSAQGLEALRARVQGALRDFFHPITGGVHGEGWELGELPFESDVYRLVTGLPGVDRVGSLSWALVSPDGSPPPASTDPALGRVLIYPGPQQVEVLAPGAM